MKFHGKNCFLTWGFVLLCLTTLSAQESKLPADTTKKVKSDAAKASIRSAILPGLGQAFNKKYWKIPIVYGVLALPVSTFNYNSKWYDRTRFAYSVRVNRDTASYSKIAPELVPLSNESLRLYRNEFRKNMDFSILGILVVWGLNVVDAAVDGHLRKFNINDELSLYIKPYTTQPQNPLGFSAVLQIGK